MESWKYDVMESWKHDHSGINFEAISRSAIWKLVLETFWKLEGQMKPDGIWKDRKTHAIVRVTPISLQQGGEPRTLKHCKNTYKTSVNFRAGARYTLYRPLIHRQDPTG